MANIKPYSSPSIPAATAANFPALKHFFKCDEAAGATSMTDSIGGVVAPTSVIAKPDAYSISPVTPGQNLASAATLTAGRWVSPGSKPVLMFAVGQFGAASQLAMGNVSQNNHLYLTGSIVGGQVQDNAGLSITATALTGGAVYGIGMYYDGTNLTSFECKADGTTAYSAKTPVAMTGWTSVGTISSLFSNTSVTSHYGFAVFHFTTALPGDIRSAVTWMTAQWKAGNKAIYPGWAGLTG